MPTCGFPITSISKIENILEKSKVNYVEVDRANNYNEDKKHVDPQVNNYDQMLKKSKNAVDIILRIHKVNEYLMENEDTKDIYEILNMVENVTTANEKNFKTI